MVTEQQRWRGLVLGTAVSDSLDLVAERLCFHRNQQMFQGQWRQRFFIKWGMCSDDTEHSVLVARFRTR